MPRPHGRGIVASLPRLDLNERSVSSTAGTRLERTFSYPSWSAPAATRGTPHGRGPGQRPRKRPPVAPYGPGRRRGVWTYPRGGRGPYGASWPPLRASTPSGIGQTGIRQRSPRYPLNGRLTAARAVWHYHPGPLVRGRTSDRGPLSWPPDPPNGPGRGPVTPAPGQGWPRPCSWPPGPGRPWPTRGPKGSTVRNPRGRGGGDRCWSPGSGRRDALPKMDCLGG